MSVVITAVVEGVIDAAVITAAVRSCGAEIGTIYGQQGKDLIRKRLRGYENAARYSPWLVVVDLDNDASCAPELVSEWLPERSSRICFRVAVREIESWLIADHERFAAFLGVAASALPDDPDTVQNPKELVVALAARSRKRAVRADRTPRPGSRRNVGVAYPSRLVEFVTLREGGWQPNAARKNSASLDAALRCIERLR